MIILDFNQIALNSIQKYNSYNKNLSENIIKHLVLNDIRFYNHKFKNQFKSLIIAADDKSYWRKTIFPFYKCKRKLNRENSNLDWNLIFNSLDSLKLDIKNNFYYKFLQVNNAEADDIIATLTKNYQSQENILIVSSDKDFKQLHNQNVKQFSPNLNAFISEKNPQLFLKTEIIKGQSKDSIPNILSPDSHIANSIRQKPITKKILNHYLEQNLYESNDPFIIRNINLLDFNFIPENIQNDILTQFNTKNTNKKSMILDYLIKNKLNNLITNLDEF